MAIKVVSKLASVLSVNGRFNKILLWHAHCQLSFVILAL